MSKVSKIRELRRSKKPAVGTLDPDPVRGLTQARKSAPSFDFGLSTPEGHLNSAQRGWSELRRRLGNV